MIQQAPQRKPSDDRQWVIIMVDVETGDRSMASKTVSTREAVAVFKSWESEELDRRGAIPMFWPAFHPLPDWLTPST